MGVGQDGFKVVSKLGPELSPMPMFLMAQEVVFLSCILKVQMPLALRIIYL